MDLRSLHSQAETFDSSSHRDPYNLFTFYHPQYHPECPTYEEDQYASFVFDDCECLGESAYHSSSVSKITGSIPRSSCDQDADRSIRPTPSPTSTPAVEVDTSP